MNVGYHFVSCSHASAEQFAAWLVSELEQRSEGLCCWLTGRDLSEQSNPLEQVDEALRRCSSLIVILAEPAGSYDEHCTAEWRRAISYNKPVTVVRPTPGLTCPLLLDTRRLIDFSTGREEALQALMDRLFGLSTPPGQLESLREQLAASRRASAYATPTNKARFLSEISALEQQIGALKTPPQQKHVVHERIASSLERERRTPTEVMAQLVATRLLAFPLIQEDFRVCYPLLARGDFASATLNHQDWPRARFHWQTVEANLMVPRVRVQRRQ
jgi:hypothetical protein